MAQEGNYRFLNQSSARRDALTGLTQSLRGQFLIGLSFCFYLTWMALCCTGPNFSVADTPFGSISSDLPFWTGPLVGIVFANIGIAVHFRRTRIVLENSRRLIVLGISMTAAAFLNVVLMSEEVVASFSSLIVYVLLSILVSVGVAFFRVEVDRLFGWIGTRQTLYQGLMGTCLSAVIFLALSRTPSAVVVVALMLSAPAAIVFLWLSIRHLPHVKFYHHGQDTELYFPLKFVTTSFVQGCAMGVLYAGLSLVGARLFWQTSSFFATVIALVLLLCCIVFMRLDFNRLIYKIAFPLVSLGFAIFALVGTFSQVGLIVVLVGFCYLDLILWSLGACLIKNMGLPAPWIASCPGAALFGGMTIGLFFMLWFTSSTPSGVQEMYFLGAFVACILLATALFLSSNSNLKHGWGTVRPGDGIFSEDELEAVVQFLSTSNELTNREAEVFLLLAQGKSRRAMCDELCVSPDTIKTHVQSVYRKLAVHAQQELIDVVLQEKESFSSEEEVSVSY